jgi:purine-binding chemotaxis protein CheW
MNQAQQFCTFFLDGHYFGVEVERVQEVRHHSEMTRVPLTHSVIDGLLNLRGQIVTAIDLRKRLELRDRAADERPKNVVVQTDDGVVSLLVDDIGDVLEVGEDTFEAAPEMLKGTARDLVRGVHKLDGALLLILDTEKAVNVS